jgi:hypothetical protein
VLTAYFFSLEGVDECLCITPGETPVHTGTDSIIARHGRITAISLFFDNLIRAAANAGI